MTAFETDRAVRAVTDWMLSRHYYVEMPATLVEMPISIEHQAMDREYTREVWVSWPALAGTA